MYMKHRILCAWIVVLTGTRAFAAPADLRLVDAAKANDPVSVRSLLGKGADVNAARSDGSTALLWVAYYNDLATARALLAAGADANVSNSYAETALSLAAQNRNLPLAEALITAGARATTSKPSGETVLMTAARGGNADIVRLLIAHGAQVNARETALEQTALMWAAARRHPAVVQALLTAGAEVNARSKKGSTALHFAVQQNDLETARLLLAAGADTEATMSVRQIDGFTLGLVETLDGVTPLLLAIADCRRDGPEYNGSTVPHPLAITCPGSEDLGLLLLQHGAQANKADGSGISALHQAVHAGMPRLAKALLEHGADVNARVPPTARQWTGQNRNGARAISPMPTGATPFFVAAWWHNPEIMRILLAGGANPKLSAEDGTNALMAASGVAGRPPMGFSKQLNEARAREAISIAVEQGLDINAVNAASQTALHGAAKLRSAALIQHLVDKGAKVDVTDGNGATPLSLAERVEYMVDAESAKKVAQLIKDLEALQAR